MSGPGIIAAGILGASALAAAQSAPAKQSDAVKAVSFYKEVRPILQAHCSGCHQPAKAGGKIVLASFADVIAATRKDEPIIVAGKTDESRLLEVISPDGEKPPKMPKGRAPLAAAQVETLRRWIAEGAADDTPAAAATTFTMERPPVYHQQPVVTSLDFSPDGSLLAVPGYHEVLLHEVSTHVRTEGRAEGGGATLVAHLVGMSERIQSATFSPDGASLLVVGGSPARLGEVQIWNVAERTLRLSIPVGFDTLYGGSWSPDGKYVAFGGGDHTLRAHDAETGEPVFFNAASEDLVLDTAFSKEASHLVSVGRDRALKLFQVGTQQFIDNITSITPGALKGGLMALDRQPNSDVLLVGGADGAPKTYNMIRTKDRVIGDDFNLVKAYAAMPGRIFAAEWSADGTRFVAGTSAGGKGELRLYAADQEAPKWTLPTETAIYAATFHPGGNVVAAAGFDGVVLLVDAASGGIRHRFFAAPVAP